MTAEPRSPIEAPFPPLPLRARGAMELLDASVKLYRQYFGVLLGWSAIVSIGSVLSSLVAGGFLALFFTPLAVGPAACCVAAAVRGQRVGFMQVWEFTKPRYWPIFLMTLLIIVVLIALLIPVVIVFGLVFGLGASANSTGLMIVGVAVVGVLLLVAAPYVYGWSGLVPVVVAFEDDKRNSQALNRAWDLPKGNWSRIVGVLIILGLAYLALSAIIGATGYLLLGGSELVQSISGNSSDVFERIMGLLVATTVANTLISMVFTPLIELCLVLFYLDSRVRREALDLEWAAHEAAPAQPGYAAPPQGFVPQTPQAPYPQGFVASHGYPQETYPPQGYPPQGYAPPQPHPQPFQPNAPHPSQVQAQPPLSPAPPFAASPTLEKSSPTPQESSLAPGENFRVAPENSPMGAENSSIPRESSATPTENSPMTGEISSVTREISSATEEISSATAETPAATVACANCNALSPRGQRFCMNCGANLPAS